MESNDVDVFDLLPQKLGGGAGDEGIADTVEAVLPQVVAPRDVLVDGVRPDVLGDGVVELAVEAGDVEGRLGQIAHAAVDDDEGCRVVQRRQVIELLEVVVGLVRDQFWADKVAAVDDAVADVGDILLAADLGHAVVVDQGLEKDVKGVCLGRHLLVFDFFVLNHLLTVPCIPKGGGWCGQAAYLGLGKLDGCLAEEGAVG